MFFAKANGKTAELFLYAPIGERFGGVSPDMVKSALDQFGKPDRLDVYIDSDGGLVDQGIAIHNILKRFGAKKRVIVDGLAASIASYIAMAGDEIVMTSNSQIMIHKAWGMAAGDDEDFISVAEGLRNATDIICDAYCARGKATKEQMYALMKAETWMKADRAMALGLVDSVEQMTPPRAQTAYAILDKFKNTPSDLRNRPNKAAHINASMEMRLMRRGISR